VAALEKIPAAARRMGVSPATVYRELKSGRHTGPLVKLGERASAVPMESTDKWIAARIAEATPQQAAKGGSRE
jgi:predicted DNA-binding transcriptional regulator AlpA